MANPRAASDWYDSQMNRHRDNARSALEEALRRMESALGNWDTGPSALNVSNARHAVQYAAEGYASLQAFTAMTDVRFLVAGPDAEPTP